MTVPRFWRGLALLAGLLPLLAGAAEAQRKVVAPTSGVVDYPGTYAGSSLSYTWNQSGLSTGYTWGVTDWDTYMALNPTHGWPFGGNEWFADIPISGAWTTAQVTYDFGSLMTLSQMALWNEDASGIGLFNLYYSINGTTFYSLLSNQVPTNNPYGSDYAASLYSWGAQSMRYVRLEMSNCPQTGPNSSPACAIGEVAFAQELGGMSPVPEPATMALLATGLVGLAGASAVRRRKRLA